MKKDVLLIAHFTDDFDTGGNNRFNYLMDLFLKNDINAELITSSFSHFKKQKKDIHNLKLDYKITFLSEPKYKKNISIKRFLSHYIFSRKLKKYLKKRKKPDVIYCAVPSLSAAKVAAEYARDNNIKFIIDIQDVWPEAFKMIFNVPLVSDFIYKPIENQADYIFESADEIVAVSQTYVDRALKVNTKNSKGHVVYLGTELLNFDKFVSNNKISHEKKEVLLCYLGTLGHSYDLTVVFEALELLKNRGIDSIKFLVIGDGPLMDKFQNIAQKKNLDVEFLGRLKYPKMVNISTSCDIAINPISKGAAQSIINKHADYSAAGLPVINTQESKEYRDIVKNHRVGLNCINGDKEDLANKIEMLVKDNELREEMGRNNRKFAEKYFDRAHTYKTLLDLIIK